MTITTRHHHHHRPYLPLHCNPSRLPTNYGLSTLRLLPEGVPAGPKRSSQQHHVIRILPLHRQIVNLTNGAKRSLLILPHEIQDEILFYLAVDYTGGYNFTFRISTFVVPYILANRTALDCWRASRSIILRRMAEFYLRESSRLRRTLRREIVLASLRRCVWSATYG
jgi:hypothetical protein